MTFIPQMVGDVSGTPPAGRSPRADLRSGGRRAERRGARGARNEYARTMCADVMDFPGT